MSLDPQSPSNNTNALDFTQPSKKDYNTIEFTNKENRQINEMVTLSLDTIQVSNVADRGVKAKPVDETYNCRNNKSKFCLPLGINSARTLEADIKKKKKEQNSYNISKEDVYFSFFFFSSCFTFIKLTIGNNLLLNFLEVVN